MIYKMKARLIFLFFICVAQSVFGQSGAETGCFEHFRQEGEAAINRRRPNYELGRKKFSAAKECPDATADQRRQMDERMREVEAKNLNALEKQIDKAEASQLLAETRAIEADKLREEAGNALEATKTALAEAEKRRLESEAATRHALANDIAFRAQTALRDGDRTTAFRLAEFAWKYVEHGNLRAQQAIVDVFYQNDKASDKCPLPWRTHNFRFDDGDLVDKTQFSSDGKRLAVSTTLGSVFVWELETGRELFFLPKQSVFGKCAFSSDCEKIAVGRKSDEVTLFSLKNNALPLRIPCTGSATLLNLLFSPNNEQISAVTEDGQLKVFNTKTGSAISTLGGESSQLLSTYIALDQKTLLFIHEDSQIEIIDIERGQRRAAFSTGNPYPLAVNISMDGKLIAVSCADRSMGIWRAEDGVKMLGFAPQALAATMLYFSTDGKVLTSTYSNNDAKNWDVSTGLEQKIDRENIDETYFDLQISPNGKFKSVFSFDRGLEVFDNKSGRRLFARPNIEDVVQYVFSPDSRMILLVHLDGSAELIDSEKGKLRYSFPISDEVSNFVFSPDGGKIAFSRIKGSLDIYELAISQAVFPKESGIWNGNAVFSPDSKLVAMPMLGDSLNIIDSKTGDSRFLWKDRGTKCLFLTKNRILSWGTPGKTHFFVSDLTTGKTIFKGELPGESESFYFQGMDAGKLISATNSYDGQSLIYDGENGQKLPICKNCYHFMVSPDGKFAVSQDSQGRAKVVRRANGEILLDLAVEGNIPLIVLSFSPDGNRLLCIDYTANAGLIYDIESKKLLHQLRDETMTIQNLFWSGDGKKVHTGDTYFSQWNAETSKLEISTYLSANRFSFSKTGERAVSLSGMREATVWDITNGRPLFTLRGHTKDILDQVFSENGTQLLTTAVDQTARLWDLGTGREMLRLQADTFEMGQAQFSPDGKLASIWQNGRATIWHLDADTVLQILKKNQLFAPLSPEQIYDFNIEEPLRSLEIFEKALQLFSAAECYELACFYLNQGILQYEIGLFQNSFRRAEKLFIKATNESDRPSVALQLADLYTQWAKKLIDNGLSAEAKKLANKVEKLTALAGGMDSKSRLQLAFAQSAVGNSKAANEIYQKLADEKEDLQQVKYALDESTRLFGKSKDAQPILEQISQELASDTIDQSAPIQENLNAANSGNISATTDWSAQVQTSKAELKNALRNHLVYGYDASIREVTNLMGNLSFYLLFEKKFDEARRFADYGLMIDTSQTFIKTNLAHAHLFAGRTEKAREIYQNLSVAPDPDNLPNTFRDTLLADFELFSQAGLRSKDLPKMVEIVSGQKLGQKERLKYLPQ